MTITLGNEISSSGISWELVIELSTKLRPLYKYKENFDNCSLKILCMSAVTALLVHVQPCLMMLALDSVAYIAVLVALNNARYWIMLTSSVYL